MTGRELGKAIGSMSTNSGKNYLDVMKSAFRSIRNFLEKFPQHFSLGHTQQTSTWFEYNITVDSNSIAGMRTVKSYDGLDTNHTVASVSAEQYFLDSILKVSLLVLLYSWFINISLLCRYLQIHLWKVLAQCRIEILVVLWDPSK
jgi:hypothetical protein